MRSDTWNFLLWRAGLKRWRTMAGCCTGGTGLTWTHSALKLLRSDVRARCFCFTPVVPSLCEYCPDHRSMPHTVRYVYIRVCLSGVSTFILGCTDVSRPHKASVSLGPRWIWELTFQLIKQIRLALLLFPKNFPPSSAQIWKVTCFSHWSLI